MTDIRYLDLDELLVVVARVTGSTHAVRDLGLLASAVERPRTNVFGTEAYPTLHEKAAALLHSIARNHALVDGNKRTAWLACLITLRINGVATPPPATAEAVAYIEAIAQGDVEVSEITKTLLRWMPA
ncbi:type II toxin-antitoxin system death-on-curing family toxin [Streptomyces sp. KLOTTS4A1]|uniref:type II toxin-antitoxin system death-on-curing family toxin n=1 Tax=Streptomyces sp. KLOTTS4A1 TaxID=3390996 RepID=UPI0039F61516